MNREPPIRIVVLSSTIFGHRCLTEGLLHTPGAHLVGIFTTPQNIDISYSDKPVNISSYVDLSDVGTWTGCEVAKLQGKITSSTYLEYLEKWRPDLLLALGWYYMIPRKVRDLPPLGCLGIHASLLPKYRGGAPIPWAIINGETEAGITLFYLGEGVDDGDIVAQESFSIADDDTCATVYEKATGASVKVLREYVPRIAAGTAPRSPQEHSQATHFPQRKPEDGLIDWSWSAKRIKDFIRAQTKPYPGAFTRIGGKRVVIWDADVEEIKR